MTADEETKQVAVPRNDEQPEAVVTTEDEPELSEDGLGTNDEEDKEEEKEDDEENTNNEEDSDEEETEDDEGTLLVYRHPTISFLLFIFATLLVSFDPEMKIINNFSEILLRPNNCNKSVARGQSQKST